MLQADFLRVTFDGRHVRSRWVRNGKLQTGLRGKMGQVHRHEAGGVSELMVADNEPVSW